MPNFCWNRRLKVEGELKPQEYATSAMESEVLRSMVQAEIIFLSFIASGFTILSLIHFKHHWSWFRTLPHKLKFTYSLYSVGELPVRRRKNLQKKLSLGKFSSADI